MSHAYIAVAAALLAGCSWVYDADDFRGRDGGGGPDDPDADPTALDVSVLAPDEVFEGQGVALAEEDQELVRAIPIVLQGQNMDDSTTFTIEGAGIEETDVAATVSDDGRFAAFELRVPIGLDSVDTLTIRVEKGSEADTELLVVRDLDGFVKDGGTIDTDRDDIAARYSHVELSGDITVVGADPLRLVATAGITVTGTLRADADGQVAGGGGCDGGAAGASADCGDGAGGGSTDDGGGGGAFGADDAIAGDGAGGDPGGAAGDVFLVPLPPPVDDTTAHGAGGGGGGSAAGGGSGGVIELTSAGVVRLDGSVISVDGGAGAEGALACTAAGNGGGGSGGAILVRSGTGLVGGPGARIEALGGAGGAGGSGACDGGAGGVGRIRIDRPDDGEPPDVAPGAFIGPVIQRTLPAITEDREIDVAIRAAPDENYPLYLNQDPAPTTITTSLTGVGQATVSLTPGLNVLCVRVSPAAELMYPESKNCLNIAYIPR